VGKRIWRLAGGCRISVTGSLWLEDRGPVVRRRERGSRGRGRWADVRAVGFFYCFGMVRGIVYFTRISNFL
jgi:hypothetical protein